MSKNIHTLHDLNKNKSNNIAQYNRGNTITETSTETEQLTIPKSHFYNILSNHRDELDKVVMEKLTYVGDIKAEREEKELYKNAMEKLKSENIKLKNYISSKVKKYSVEDLNAIEHNINDKSDYFLKNQENIVQELYNKKHSSRLKALREELNDTIMSTHIINE